MKRGLFTKTAMFAVLMTMFCGCIAPVPDQQIQNSPVQASYLAEINSLFQRNGFNEATAGIDSYGRVILKGNYSSNREVDKAFSLAQTVVGPKWVSPVTPENIKVKEWELKLSALFPKKKLFQSVTVSPRIPESSVSQTPSVGAKYAVVVGISKFQEEKFNLRYAQNDAKIVYKYLIDPLGGNFREENVSLILNENATRDNISKALDKIQQRAKEDDIVLLFFSTHGTPPSKFGGVYIVSYDTIFKPRESVWESSITGQIFRDFIAGVKAKRLIILIDACYSNGAFSKIEGFLPTGGKSLGIGDEDEVYGVSLLFRNEKILGAKDIILDDEPEQTSKPSSSGSGVGKILISASDDNEQSFESEALKHGFFTFYFIEGLKKFGNVKDAFYYAKPLIKEEVWKEKGRQQNPQILADRKDWNIKLK